MAAMTLRHGFGLLQELWDERVEAQECAGSEQSQKLFVYRLTLNITTQQQDFTRPYKEERRSYNATVLQCARPDLNQDIEQSGWSEAGVQRDYQEQPERHQAHSRIKT